MEKTQRLQYIDCLRGLSILMVVYYHTILFVMGNHYESLVTNFFVTFFMHLFFFISGYITYNKSDWDFKSYFVGMKKRVIRQLIPTIVIGFFYISCFNLNLKSAIYDDAKAGYWFTFVAFQIFIVYGLVRLIALKLNNNRTWEALVIYCISILFIEALRMKINLDGDIANLFSLVKTLVYYKFFIAGILFKHYYISIMHYLENRFITFILILVAMIPCFYEISVPMMLRPLISITRIICLFLIFYHYRLFLQNSWFGKKLAIIGRYTLEIYLLHYFFLIRIPESVNIFNTINGYEHSKGIVLVLEILIIGGWSAFISFICIGIRKIADTFPLVTQICFGHFVTPTKNVN